MMIKVKTAELTGITLDWSVAKCEATASPAGLCQAEILLYRSKAVNAMSYKSRSISYSTDWSQGGPIIDRELIATAPSTEHEKSWVATTPLDGERFNEEGPTPLVAAMRCYVASRIGDVVEVPQELLA